MSAAHPAPERAYPTADVLRLFASSFAGILKLVQRLIPLQPRPDEPGIALYNYISRTRLRFERLLARLAAGIQPRPQPPRPDRKPSTTPRLRLSRRYAWLRTALGYNAGNFGSQIAFLLDEPETAALVASSPQAQRLLRPLLHMLGAVPPACIPPLPQRPRKPRPKPAPRPRRLTRKELKALLWYPNIEGRPMNLIPPRKFRA
jgi:hypothetical protein